VCNLPNTLARWRTEVGRKRVALRTELAEEVVSDAILAGLEHFLSSALTRTGSVASAAGI